MQYYPCESKVILFDGIVITIALVIMISWREGETKIIPLNIHIKSLVVDLNLE